MTMVQHEHRSEQLPWPEVFERLRPKIERALAIGGHTYDFNSLGASTARGRFMLFYTNDAVMLCEIVDFPLARVLNFFMAAGDLDDCLMLEGQACDWGMSHGCTHALMLGRRGWQRVLRAKGWHSEPLIVLTKELTFGHA